MRPHSTIHSSIDLSKHAKGRTDRLFPPQAQHMEQVWTNKQEVCSVKYESKNKALPSVKPPTQHKHTQTHPHLRFNQHPPPPTGPWHNRSLETLHLLHFQQLITNMGLGGRGLSWRWGQGSGELWPFRTVSTDRAGECVCARVRRSPPIFTHNPLPPLCFFGLSNGGCHGQSLESPADLLQVALWLLSSPRSGPDPWPLTLQGLPCALTEDRLELLLRGEATWGLDQTERFVCGNGSFHNSRAPTSRLTTTSDLHRPTSVREVTLKPLMLTSDTEWSRWCSMFGHFIWHTWES